MEEINDKYNENPIMMPRYMVHLWGIIISPILAIAFMAINLRKLGRKEGLQVVSGAILVTAMVLFLPYEFIVPGWMIGIVLTVIFVE